jgi:hypothetical protein
MDGFSVSSLITGLASGVISSVLTYFGTRSKIRLDLTVEYDKALHDKRLALYKELWPITKPLGRFVPHFSLTYNHVKRAVTDMHEWYFKEGGIYLSKNSREPYFHLKEQMLRVIDNERLEATPDARIDDKEACKAILDAATSLRTSLADDIRTRRSPWL